MATAKADEDLTFLGEHSGGVQMWIRPAIRKQDHQAIAKVAAQDPVCAAFKRSTYSGAAVYAEGRIRVLVDVEPDGTQRCVGFSCSKPGDGETKLFFLAVEESLRRKGCGTELLFDVQKHSEARRVTTTLPKTCEAGLAFCAARGFYEHGRTAKGGVRLRLDDDE